VKSPRPGAGNSRGSSCSSRVGQFPQRRHESPTASASIDPRPRPAFPQNWSTLPGRCNRAMVLAVKQWPRADRYNCCHPCTVQAVPNTGTVDKRRTSSFDTHGRGIAERAFPRRLGSDTLHWYEIPGTRVTPHYTIFQAAPLRQLGRRTHLRGGRRSAARQQLIEQRCDTPSLPPSC
jgi:hypothetical protein